MASEHFLILSSRPRGGGTGKDPGTPSIGFRFHGGSAVSSERTRLLLAWDPSATAFMPPGPDLSVLLLLPDVARPKD